MGGQLFPVEPVEIAGNSIGLSSEFLGTMAFFQGTFTEKFDALATSDGATITMTLEQVGGGDLTMNFSDGYSVLVCTPTACSIALTAGTDIAEQANYIYVLQSTKALTKSTSGWPDTEHIKVGYFLCQSASLVNTGAAGNNWLLANQNWNDFAAGTNNQGHLTHITARVRGGGARWLSGCEGVATQDGNDLWVSVAAGVVRQLHEHAFAALDSDTAGAGDPIVVFNDPDAANTLRNSLNEITKLSDGDSISNNKYVKFVLSGVANKGGEVSPMLLALPAEQYNTQSEAEKDVDGHANFTIPDEYIIDSSTGFLIAAFVCQHTATAMLIKSTQNLRGSTPFNVSGSGTGGGDVTSDSTITDNAVVVGDGGAKGIQGRGVLIDDSDNMSAIANLDITGILSLTDTDTGFSAAAGLLFYDVAAIKSHVFRVGNVAQLYISDDVLRPAFTGVTDLGITTKKFKDGFFAGDVLAGSFSLTDADTGLSTSSGDLLYDVAAGKSHQLRVGNVGQIIVTDGTIEPVTDGDIDLGDILGGKRFKAAGFTGGVAASAFISGAATGTIPYGCTSTSNCTNLSADMVDGEHASAFAAAAHTHALAAGATDVTATFGELNLLDLAGLTAGWVLAADSATTASWQAPAGGGGGMSDLIDDTTPQLGGNLDTDDKHIQNDGAEAYVTVDDSLWITGGLGTGGTLPNSAISIFTDTTGTAFHTALRGVIDYTGASQTVYGVRFTAEHNSASPAGNQSSYGGRYDALNYGVMGAGNDQLTYGIFVADPVAGGLQTQATSDIKAYGAYLGAPVHNGEKHTGGNFYFYSLFAERPSSVSPDGSPTSYNEWSALFEGDVQINSGEKLILEGSATVKGDTYLVFQNSRIEFFLNGTLEGYVDTTGFVSV